MGGGRERRWRTILVASASASLLALSFFDDDSDYNVDYDGDYDGDDQLQLQDCSHFPLPIK